MQLTVQVKLLADTKDIASLKKTLVAANSACDWISEYAWARRIFRMIPLHRAAYHPCRLAFPNLASQIIIRANAKVVDSYAIDQKVCRVFKPLGSFPYDQRILSWNMKSITVSIWTMAGRLSIPFVCGQKQRDMLEFERGQACLVYRSGKFYLFVSVALPETTYPPCKEWLGIDLGLANLARSSSGQTFGDARKTVSLRKRRWRQRKRLQSRGTRSARRVLKRLRGREARFIRHENHVISKQICDVAKRTGRGIALENLKGIRSRIRANKKQRRILHSWAFADLQAKIAYKSRLIGVPVIFVDPRNTSRTCPACGSISKKNRPTRDTFACQSCGFTADADTNAASNIAGRAAVILPDERASVRIGAHAQNLSLVTG